ncbi:hypothetical protein NP511_07780 [Natrinema thermotolerans]|uniref:Uncharacterized protein n=1 Tax=Natrinema thermotolerans TaxID=121872 RepID=A0AAF0PHX6_9EURY|nr:hypothetical protein [Natrinema thermotolerans]WMT09530.1 hypothetical protein NP511_07780 [Natrinema thermotolerans]
MTTRPRSTVAAAGSLPPPVREEDGLVVRDRDGPAVITSLAPGVERALEQE